MVDPNNDVSRCYIRENHAGMFQLSPMRGLGLGVKGPSKHGTVLQRHDRQLRFNDLV
jgi:hypothetical protein